MDLLGSILHDLDYDSTNGTILRDGGVGCCNPMRIVVVRALEIVIPRPRAIPANGADLGLVGLIIHIELALGTARGILPPTGIDCVFRSRLDGKPIKVFFGDLYILVPV